MYEVINAGMKMTVPKLLVILHYFEFIMTSIKNILNGKKPVDSSYHIGSSYYVSCATPYRNFSIQFWKNCNGKKIPHLTRHFPQISGVGRIHKDLSKTVHQIL